MRTVKKSGKRPGIFLPWERRIPQWSGLLGGSRWKILLIVLLSSSLAWFLYGSAVRRARIRASQTAIAELRKAVEEFRSDHDRCPERETELIRPPRSSMRYLREIPKDGWNRSLYLRCPSLIDPDRIDVVSSGLSGSFFVDDNIQ
ncbi:MAG: type II secretion system protein GspG [Myxococcota bacterium]